MLLVERMPTWKEVERCSPSDNNKQISIWSKYQIGVLCLRITAVSLNPFNNKLYESYTYCLELDLKAQDMGRPPKSVSTPGVISLR